MSIEDRVFISTSCVDGDRNIAAVLDRLDKLSIRNVELSGPHPYVQYEDLVSLLLEYRNRGMTFIVHNYFPPPESDFVLNIASFNEDTIRNSRTMIQGALDLAQEIDALFYGCHAGYLADASSIKDGFFQFDPSSLRSKEDCIDRTARTVKEVFQYRESSVSSDRLLLENLFPASPAETFSLACTPQEIKDLVKALDGLGVGLLLDLAHLELTCRIYGLNSDEALDEIITTMGDAIRSIHMSGHNGKTDEHALMESGSWQLQAARHLNTVLGMRNEVVFTLECRKMNDEILLSQMNQLIHYLE